MQKTKHIETIITKGIINLLPSYKQTLNGQLIREGEDYPCYDFPEPLVLEGIKKP